MPRRTRTTEISEKSWKDVVKGFKVLLGKSHHRNHEQEIQAYLERFPLLLPGLFDYHNGPADGKVISKLNLGDFIPDFLFATQTTGDIQFTFVEIEDPCKRVFTQTDAFTGTFRQALQQVIDWVGSWDQIRPRLQNIFGPLTNLRYSDGTLKHMSCKAILIYGRRDEINNRKRNERWSAEVRVHRGSEQSIEVMTYDRLLPLDFKVLEWVYLPYKNLSTFTYQDRQFVAKCALKE
ncbi:MAG: DUF4263 domain-containing protein [Nitrospirae bacterium]|nr:DUF4263 domain-containing protein [Nitrospirota bacterium]